MHVLTVFRLIYSYTALFITDEMFQCFTASHFLPRNNYKVNRLWKMPTHTVLFNV